MESIVLQSTIKSIAINDEDGNVKTVLKVDVSDGRTLERFNNVITTLNGIEDKSRKASEELEAKFGNVSDDEFYNIAVEAMELKNKIMLEIIEAIDGLFGEGTIRNVFAENYAINSDYIPDEDAITEFILGIVPVMTKLFNKRTEDVKKRYNKARTGKHAKSKDELIAEYRAKAKND